MQIPSWGIAELDARYILLQRENLVAMLETHCFTESRKWLRMTSAIYFGQKCGRYYTFDHRNSIFPYVHKQSPFLLSFITSCPRAAVYSIHAQYNSLYVLFCMFLANNESPFMWTPMLLLFDYRGPFYVNMEAPVIWTPRLLSFDYRGPFNVNTEAPSMWTPMPLPCEHRCSFYVNTKAPFMWTLRLLSCGHQCSFHANTETSFMWTARPLSCEHQCSFNVNTKAPFPRHVKNLVFNTFIHFNYMYILLWAVS